jgi:hypothetical protein
MVLLLASIPYADRELDLEALDRMIFKCGDWSNMRLSGRAVNKVPGLSLRVMSAMMQRRAAQLWR